MKKLLLSLLLFISALLPAVSQTTAGSNSINGTVLDSALQKPAEFATINLKNARQQLIKTAVTKPDGSFSFEKLGNGQYFVTVVSLGYVTKTMPADLSKGTSQLGLGTILLNKQIHQLKAITLTADRPIIKQEVDRISYDLQADPESKVNSVLEMMRKVPMLSLDADDNIQLQGNSNYKILINGKPSSMVERSPKEILRSMPASTIQKIEVITTPPAKYDGEGLAGIINIITNKKVDNGYNGSINMNERFPVGGPGIGSSFTFKQGKLGLSAFGGGSLYNTPGADNSSIRVGTRSQPTTLSQFNTRETNSKSAYLGTEISYEIDSLNLVSGQFNLNGNNSDGESVQNSILSGQTGIMQSYDLSNINKGSGDGFDAAINYQLGFKQKKNRLLTMSYRYYAFGNDQNNNLSLSKRINYTLPDYHQLNKSNFDEQTFQLDYVHPAKKWNIEAGFKGIFRTNESDFQYHSYQTSTGQFEIDPSFTNTFNNKQDVYGLYNTYQYSAKNWGVKAGMRIENTVVDADFISTSSAVKQNYFNFLPSVALNFKLKNMNSLNLGFTQRMQRPGINQLNPYIDRSNPNFESAGNPELRPTVGTQIQLGFSLNKKASINFNLKYLNVNGLIFPVSAFDEASNITLTRFENTGKAQGIGSNLNINYPITPKWTISANGNATLARVKGLSNGAAISNQGLMYNAYASSGYRFENGWRINASLNMNGTNLTIQERTQAFLSSSFSVNKDLVKDKLSFSISSNNPFSKFRTTRTYIFGPNYNQNNDSQQYFRNTSFSLNYRFGKFKEAIKKNKRGISNDDVSQ